MTEEYSIERLKQEATEQLKDIVYVCRIHGWSKNDIDGFVQDGWDYYDKVEAFKLGLPKND